MPLLLNSLLMWQKHPYIVFHANKVHVGIFNGHFTWYETYHITFKVNDLNVISAVTATKIMGVYYWTMTIFIITGVLLSMEARLAFIFNCNWLYCFQCLLNVVEFFSPPLHLLCLELVTNTDGYKNNQHHCW